MKLTKLTIKLFTTSLLVFFLAFPISNTFSQEESETDFSNAIDGEEKRKTWGTEEHKQSLIEEMSSANVSPVSYTHLTLPTT